MDLTEIKGIGPVTKEKLQEAGIEEVADLQDRDADELAEAVGISASRIEDFVAQAHELVGEAADAAEEAASAEPDLREQAEDAVREAAQAMEDFQVVLRDKAHSARVKVGETWHENVPIVTATIDESAERKMQQLREDAVLLKEKARTAYVRVGDTWHENVPIFRERETEGGVVEQTRVKVDQIRERTQEAGEGLLQKVKGLFKS